MPLSSGQALRSTWRLGPAFAFSRISSAQVKAINEWIAVQAIRFVYFHRKGAWVVPLIESARSQRAPP